MTELFGRVTSNRNASTPPDDLQADEAGMRWLRRHLSEGVSAVTTLVDGVYRASTVTACFVASVQPPQILISFEKDSQMDGWLQESAVFGISFLTWKQQFLADQFAGFTPLASSTFRGIDHLTAETGSPLLTDSLGWADCRVVQTFETGDHRCFVGEVVAVGRGKGDIEDPLVYYLGRYRRFPQE